MSLICFDDVTLKLGGRTVLAGVQGRIEPGEFIGVLGPNGAGKTTLLRAILGRVRPRTGRIMVSGEIGYLPQAQPGTATRLRGEALLASSIRGARLGLPLISSADRAEIARVLMLPEAAELAARPIGTLSGGERQRVLLAQALLGRPRVLLLDEPLAGLDPRRQQQIVSLVSRLRRELGLTVLLSAHELNPLLRAVDRVLYLGHGNAALGAVDEIVTGPVLSRLYGSAIDVVRANGRIFVVPRDPEAAALPQAAEACAPA